MFRFESGRAGPPAAGIDARRRALLAGSAGAALAMAGCAAPGSPEAPPPGERSWQGRFAVTWTVEAQPPRQERASGRFALRALGERTELEVFSPFGQTVARALSRPEGAVLETANGRRYEAGDAEALTEQVLGWRAPVQLLPQWLSGAGPDRQVQGGWEARVDAREQDRPHRLTLAWPAQDTAAEGPRVTIRLVLDDPDAPSTGEAR